MKPGTTSAFASNGNRTKQKHRQCRVDRVLPKASKPVDFTNKKARCHCRRGLYEFRDDVVMQVICPTSQTWSNYGKALSGAHQRNGDPLRVSAAPAKQFFKDYRYPSD